MIQASICTIGDEILIGQVVDTNSSRLAVALEEAGIRVTRMLSIGDDREEILNNLRNELTVNDIVITTGGLGPTKDDITKGVLAELSGSAGFVEHAGQLAIVQDILRSRGLDMLASNRAQALVPDRCEVIENHLGTAPIMVFRFPETSFGATLYALPGVPFEAVGAIPSVMEDIRAHQPLNDMVRDGGIGPLRVHRPLGRRPADGYAPGLSAQSPHGHPPAPVHLQWKHGRRESPR